MFFQASFLTLALVLLVAASPVKQAVSGSRIPLSNRVALTKPDGTFDFEEAILEVIKTQNKYRQNLINLERSSGREAFNEGAEILPLATIPSSLQRRQSETLTEVQNGRAWAGEVSIGTPSGQNFLIDFDTGSSDFWVTSASCTNSTCSSKKKYTASESNTSAKQNGSFAIHYADNSTVSGPVYSDTVSVAGVTVKGQFFSPVTTLSRSFESNPIDGILGLAFPAISHLHQDPFFVTSFKQGAVQQNEFAFKLAKTGSSLYLGGTDSSLFNGSIEFHDINTKTGFWQTNAIAKVLVGSNTAVSGFETNIDSGTTLMYGPPSHVKTFYSKVQGAHLLDSARGLYSFPCASVPPVSFNWGGKNWPISSINFNLGKTAPGSNQCVGALLGHDLGIGNNVWLLGDRFMQNVYTVFSFNRSAVGFATLA